MSQLIVSRKCNYAALALLITWPRKRLDGHVSTSAQSTLLRSYLHRANASNNPSGRGQANHDGNYAGFVDGGYTTASTANVSQPGNVECIA